MVLLHRRVRRLLYACAWRANLRHVIGMRVLRDDVLKLETAIRRLHRVAPAQTASIRLRAEPEEARLELIEAPDHAENNEISLQVSGAMWETLTRRVKDTGNLALVWRRCAMWSPGTRMAMGSASEREQQYTFEALMAIARHDAPVVLEYLRSLFAGCQGSDGGGAPVASGVAGAGDEPHWKSAP